MSHLAISLLGSFQVTLDDRPLNAFATDKVRALLAFLVVESDRSHRRETLVSLLWPDRPQAAACNSLRQTLFQLRQTLAGSNSSVPHLLASAKEIRFNPASDYWLDMAEQEICLALVCDRLQQGQDLCADCLSRLEKAVELYRGDFLSGFSLPGCSRFGWWQLSLQEACHRQVMDALSTLVDYYEAQQMYERVCRYAIRKIELEPYRESAYQRYMRALAFSGRRGEALQQYEICRKRLAVEMQIEPSAETTRLYQQIRAGTLPGLN